MYGSPREFSDFSDKYEHLNIGKVPAAVTDFICIGIKFALASWMELPIVVVC